MEKVVNWIWYGPWWAAFIGAIYFAVIVSIVFSPFIGAMHSRR